MSVLVVAAHPDDEVLGCGATMARMAREGERVYIAILGEGITSRYAERGDADPALLRNLRADAERAAELVGAAQLFTYDLPDNRFDTVPTIDVVKIVEDLIEQTRPHTVFTHHPGDLNVDHSVLHRAVVTATRPVGTHVVREVYAFEVPSSSDFAFSQFVPFRPSFFVDVTDTLDVKIAAMECYESEARPFPHPRSPEALAALARRWGSAVGLQAAEAFETVRRII